MVSQSPHGCWDVTEVDSGTLELLASVTSATVTSCLQRRGIRTTFMAGLLPLAPAGTMVGVARTLRYLPAREDLAPRYSGGGSAQRRAVEAVEPGEVLVISARGVIGAGTIGDIYALRVAALGGAGVVTDGATRDTPALAATGLPVYAQACHGATLMRAHLPVDMQVPIECAGVTVLPGDVIMGDREGVVCVPAALAADVASEAVEQELREEFATEKIRAGSPCAGYFPLTEARRDEFEQWQQARRAHA